MEDSSALAGAFLWLGVFARFVRVGGHGSNGDQFLRQWRRLDDQPVGTFTSANITGNVFHGTDGNGGEGVTAW